MLWLYMQKHNKVMIDQVTEENREELEKEIWELQDKMETLLKEIKEAKAELKERYEGEL